MKNLVALLILAIWLAFGAWYYACKVRNLCGSNIEKVTSVTNSDSDGLPENMTPTKLKMAYQNLFNMEDGLEFQFSEEQVIVNPAFDEGIDNMASFLLENPSNSVFITGPYTSDEENFTKETNLGKARAIAIQEILVEKGISEDQIVTAGVVEEDMYINEEAIKVLNFDFSETNSDFNESELRSAYKAIDNLERDAQFYKDGEEVIFIQEPNESISKLDFFLNKNRNYFLQITGPYIEEETASSSVDNIGLVRAYHLKGQLEDYSLNQERVLIDSQLEDNLFDETDYSFPKKMEMNLVFPDKEDEAKQREVALEYALANLLTTETETEPEIVEEDLVVENEVPQSNTSNSNTSDAPIKFGFGSHTVRMNSSVEDYVKELKDYLAEYPDKNVNVIGHTDNSGSKEFNLELGRIRGLSARNLLINYKIAPNRIRVVSEGELSPIASNDSKKGRRMNRRVEIDIE